MQNMSSSGRKAPLSSRPALRSSTYCCWISRALLLVVLLDGVETMAPSPLELREFFSCTFLLLFVLLICLIEFNYKEIIYQGNDRVDYDRIGYMYKE